MQSSTNVYLPKWFIALYAVLAIVLIPWIFNLAVNLPTRHIARHWDALWVGFDFIIVIALSLTLLFAIKKQIWVTLSATSLATLFIVDAWFDILTSRPGKELRTAIVLGTLEVFLAILTLKIVYHVVQRTASDRNIKFRTS